MGRSAAARIALAAIATAFAVGGCSGTPAPRADTTLGVGERDFHITAPARLAAGIVTIRDHNRGPDTHELIVVRAATDRLPLRSDGLTVDEAAIRRQTVGAVDAVPPGTTSETRLRLRPGRYLLFCNMAGHFRGGMHTALVVS